MRHTTSLIIKFKIRLSVTAPYNLTLVKILTSQESWCHRGQTEDYDYMVLPKMGTTTYKTLFVSELRPVFRIQ